MIAISSRLLLRPHRALRKFITTSADLPAFWASLVLLLCLAWAQTAAAQSSSSAGRWVQLAVREVPLKSRRASFDVSKAKGSFTAIRVAVRSGAMVLSDIEIRYGDGDVYREPRALVMLPSAPTGPIGKGRSERFVDAVALRFRQHETGIETAVIVVEGLQTAAGAEMVRGQPAVATSVPPPQAFETAAPRPPAAESAKERPPAAAAEAAPPPPRPAASAPSATGGGIRGGLAASATDLWDVVPVYYGTDRSREDRAERAVYSGERARRLELGRALVTVPKSHQVPKVERPWTYRLPFTQIVLYRQPEDPARHFTIKEARSLSRDEFLEAVRARLKESTSYKGHALVFVHGFNVSFDNAVFRTAQLAYDLKFDGAPFVYSWPSKGTIGLNDYPYDRESSSQAEPYLRDFLEMVARDTGATSVSIIAHSMGNQLLLPVLRQLKGTVPEGLTLSQIIMAAPDVDKHTFENLAKEIAGATRSMTLMAASNDIALGISRRFWGGVPRAGDVPAGGPIVVAGVDTIDITSLSTEMFSLNHSGFAQKSALLSDIQALIQTGARPPDIRVPTLQRMKGEQGEYWRYPILR